MHGSTAATWTDTGDRWDAADSPRAEFRLLGHLEVGNGDSVQAFGGPKQRALLAFLLMHAGEVVTTDRLVDAIWGDEPPPTAAAIVYGYIRKLRSALAATSAVLTTRSSGYVLDIPGGSLDVAQFERLGGLGRQALRTGDVVGARRLLGSALGLWRGQALDGLDGEGFIHAERSRLESLRLTTMLGRIDADLRLGGAADVVEELGALAREHPLDEGIRGQLMLALCRTGNQAEALAAYQDIRRVLAEELGLDPSRSLQELEGAILRQDPSLEPSGPGAGVRTVAGAPRTTPPVLHLVEATDACPFVGLATFSVQDADVFFGRERLVTDMVARLAEHTFLGVIGPSGCGKSSAVRAGLVPAIEAGALGDTDWLRVILRPGAEPMRELDRVVFAALDESQRSRLPVAEDPLLAASLALQEGTRLLVIVDQFEEVFTSVRDPAARSAFIETLVAAARAGTAAVVLALRADFYGRCAEEAALAEQLATSQVLVGPMGRDEYRSVIEGPASRAGLVVEPALVERLIDEVEGRPGGLPLLSTALVELWERRDGRTIRLSALAATGGISGAVGRLAENAYGQLTDAERAAARIVFLRLVGGEGEAMARRRVSLTEFDIATNLDVQRTLSVLTAARLLTADRGTIEVAHEALFREWPRLEGWLDEDQQSRRVRAHLTEAAHEWDESGRMPGDLYRGARLAAVLDWMGEHGAEVNDLEREFVAESRAVGQAEERRQRQVNRRLRLMLAGGAALLVVAVGAAGFAFLQYRAADRATAEALAQRSVAQSEATAADATRLGAQALATKDLDLSLLLARQGVALDDTPVTRENLLADLERSPDAIRISRPLPGRLNGIDASGDGSTLMVWNAGGETFAVIDTVTGHTRYTFPNSGHYVGLGQDGSPFWLADRQIVTLDLETGAVAGTRAVPVDAPCAYGLTPDGTQVADVTATGDTVIIYDVGTGQEVRRIEAPAGKTFWSLNLYPGGYLVTSDLDGPLPTDCGDPDAPGDLAWWGPTSTEPLVVFPVPHVGTSYSIAPDGSMMAVDDLPSDGHETLVDLTTGVAREVGGQHGGAIIGSAFSPDSRSVVTAGDDQVARVWDVATGSLRATLEGHSGKVFAPAVTDVDGQETVWTASLDGSMMAWDLTGDRRLGVPFQAGGGVARSSPTDQVNETVPRVALSPDGRLLAIAQTNGVAIRDASSHLLLRTIDLGTRGIVPVVAWSPDGTRLGVAGDRQAIAELFDTATWRSVRGPLSAVDASQPARSIAFSADSSRVLVGGDDGLVWSWDAHSGEPLGRPLTVGAPVLAVDVSPTSDWFAVALDAPARRVRVFAPGEARPRYTVDQSIGPTGAVAFSPDGTTLATGGGAGEVSLWDATTGASTGPAIHVVSGWILSLGWSGDGASLVTGGTDGTAKVIDAGSQAVTETFVGEPNQWLSAVSTADARRVIEIYQDGQGFDWSSDPEDWATRACAEAGRTLTRAEWTQYLPGRPYAPACDP